MNEQHGSDRFTFKCKRLPESPIYLFNYVVDFIPDHEIRENKRLFQRKGRRQKKVCFHPYDMN